MAVANTKSYLVNIKKVLRRKWPGNRTVNIVCHGHSVPSGYFKTPVVDTFNSYPHLLHLELKKKYPYAVINVIVTAIGGENSINGAKRFKKDALAQNPDVITIDYSLNDRGNTLLKAERAWSSMIKEAKARGIRVVLLTPTPDWVENLKDEKTPLNIHAKQVKMLAGKYSVGLVDSLAQFKKKIAKGENVRKYLSQINHPNRKGHELVVAELLKWF